MTEEENIVSVSSLNQYVSALLGGDANLNQLAVQGEISGFKRHTSGHLYFTLKDESASVRCVMFRGNAMTLRFQPKDGLQVVLRGYASLFQRDGSFQLYAKSLDQCGEGELYKVFCALKNRLEQQGYFDPAHKRAIPFLPARVGVVTSATGAALQDILSIIGRRYPNMPVVVCPVKVQGEGSAIEIAEGIRRMNRLMDCDVLIVGRGGGSMEDLWAFNEPAVAQAVYQSSIPIISAVGHETDFTIADFTADLRAPTPSAAAELAVPEYAVLTGMLDQRRRRLVKALSTDLTARRDKVKYKRLSSAFVKSGIRVDQARLALDQLMERHDAAARQWLKEERGAVLSSRMRLEGMNPEAVLKRGYAYLADMNGKTISQAAQAQCGDTLRARLKDGALTVKVMERELRNHG